jgi:hypothetical protein
MIMRAHTAGTVDQLDLARLENVVRPFDRVASIYLAGTPVDANVDRPLDLDLRLRAIFAELVRAAAPPSLSDAVREHLVGYDSPHPVAVFAGGDRVLLAHPAPGADWPDQAAYAAPAHVLPLLDWLAAHPPYVEVVTDRTGADITAVARGATAGRTTTIVGPDDEIERNAPGGWAQPRYQRRAEDSWRHNAGAVADAAVRALRRVQADLLVVAGDVRAVQLLVDHLPHRWPRVRQIPGGRRPDGSDAARLAGIAERAAYADAITAARVAEFVDASRGIAAQGVDDTVAALAAGNVRTLLVNPDAAPGRRAWFGPEELCLSRLGERRPPAHEGALVDVAVRAALLTHAQVYVVGPTTVPLVDRLGGLCRYP